MINLTIDIGNSRTKIAVFENDNNIFNASFEKIRVNTIESVLVKYNRIENCIIAVTGSCPENIIGYLAQRFNNFLNLNHQTPVNFSSDYITLHSIGLDRLASVAGALELYNNKNCLIIDAGTAITYDIITKGKIHKGGNISPGMNLRFKALNDYTSKLPLITSENDVSIIGLDTKQAILNGVINGIVGEIEYFIREFNSIYEDLTIILTGGDAEFFVIKLKKTIFVVQNLVSIGLNSILKYNVAKN